MTIHLAALVLLSASIAPTSTTARIGEYPTLDPTRYESSSKRYALVVDPSHPTGRGFAQYRQTLDGDELWSSEKPYTFWEAVVTDEGVSVGYAYTHGVYGSGKDGFIVAVIDARGREIARHAWERIPHGPEGPYRPEAAGIRVDDEARSVVLDILDGPGRRDVVQSLWRFRLDDGVLSERSPAPTGTKVRSPRAGSFPHSTNSRALDTAAMLRPTPLRELSRTELGTPTIIVDEEDPRPMPSVIGEAFVDRGGRVVTLNPAWKLAQMFDASGAEIARGRLGTEDELSIGLGPTFVDPGDGGILVRVRGGHYARFDAAGKYVGHEDVVEGSGAMHCAYQPGSARRWVVRAFERKVIDAGTGPGGNGRGEPITRRPDGRWLRNVHALTATQDGTLFVHDGSSQLVVPVPTAICVYPSDDKQGMVLELPVYIPAGSTTLGKMIGVARDWILLASSRSDVYLIDRKGDRILRGELGPVADEELRSASFPSPDGRELWRVEFGKRTLVRYALP